MASPKPVTLQGSPPLPQAFLDRYRESVAARESIRHHTRITTRQVHVQLLGVVNGNYRFRETVISEESGVSYTRTVHLTEDNQRWLRNQPDFKVAETICYAGAGIAAIGMAGWVIVESGVAVIVTEVPGATMTLKQAAVRYWTRERVITAATSGAINVAVGEAVSPLLGHNPDRRETVLNFGFGAATGLVFPLPELGLLEAVANGQWNLYFWQSLQRGVSLHGPMGATWSVANLALHPEQNSGPVAIADQAISGFVAGAIFGPVVENSLYGIAASSRPLPPAPGRVLVASAESAGVMSPADDLHNSIHFMNSHVPPPSSFFSRTLQIDFDSLVRAAHEISDTSLSTFLETHRSAESGKGISIRIDMERDGAMTLYLEDLHHRVANIPTRLRARWIRFFEEHDVEFPRVSTDERETVPFGPATPPTPPFKRTQTADPPSGGRTIPSAHGLTELVPRPAFPAFTGTPTFVRALVVDNHPLGKALNFADDPTSLIAFDTLLERAINEGKGGAEQYARLPNGWSVQITPTHEAVPITAPPGQPAKVERVFQFRFFRED